MVKQLFLEAKEHQSSYTLPTRCDFNLTGSRSKEEKKGLKLCDLEGTAQFVLKISQCLLRSLSYKSSNLKAQNVNTETSPKLNVQ